MIAGHFALGVRTEPALPYETDFLRVLCPPYPGMKSKKRSKPSLNIKAVGGIPWRSDRVKQKSQRVSGSDEKFPLNISPMNARSDVILHSKRVVPSHSAQGSVTNEKTMENDANIKVKGIYHLINSIDIIDVSNNVDQVSEKDIDCDAANFYPNYLFSKTSVKSQSTRESINLITPVTSVEKSNYIDLVSNTSDLHGVSPHTIMY
jgi:hypothetical protein